MASSPRLVSVAFVLILFLLAGSDFLFKESGNPAYAGNEGNTETTVKRVVKKGQSTKKKSSVNIDELINRLGYMSQETSEASLLSLGSPPGTPVRTIVLLKDNDRAALLSWIEADDVKEIFGAVKQSLQQSFSGDLQDLVDQTITPDDGPTFNVLSFFDPAIADEKLVFLRVRDRLYELHMAQANEVELQSLLLELQK